MSLLPQEQRIKRQGGHPLWSDIENLRAEVERLRGLLREARMGVKNSSIQFGYPYTDLVDRIDAALARCEK